MKSFLVSVLLIIFLCKGLQAKCTSNTPNKHLLCYYGNLDVPVEECRCTHIVLPPKTTPSAIEQVKSKTKAKVLLRVNQIDADLLEILNKTALDGLEINLLKLTSRHDVEDFFATIRTKLERRDLFLALSLPAKTETLAKYFDLKALSKEADLFVLRTHWLGVNANVTFHPSRLSGLWDVQNTDSVVDLVSGLGAPLSKLVISVPVQGFQFKLQNANHTAPGSPALELKSIDRDQLCKQMQEESWTLERDQDQAAPYIFKKSDWIAFEDATSIDIKAKYTRVRNLGGMALLDLAQDSSSCAPSILQSAYEGLTKQARAPRGAVLQSLKREILQSSPQTQNLKMSPFRISRIIDTEGTVHAIREDTRTEFECSRQGYFVHPRSCNRFYRCVKFDQLTDDFSVFEFDCPAGLAFDETVEVCVWPGSLPDGAACSGSSEIAPVPKERFSCPNLGYFADPENCRWFFACMDHGESALTAYEFRCPYGLVFDEERLLCEWSWLVPKCGSGNIHKGTTFYGRAGIPAETTVYGRAESPIDTTFNGRAGSPTETTLYHSAESPTKTTVYGGAESRTVEDDLNLYSGLGTLPNIHLGGINGPLSDTLAKTFSSYQRNKAGFLQESAENTGDTSAETNLESRQNVNGETGTPLHEDLFKLGHQVTQVGNLGIATGSQGPTAGIDLVNGGYSGVLNADLSTVTPSPTTSSVTQASVPSTTLNTYSLGEINIPNLQFKLEHPLSINNQIYNASSTYVNDQNGIIYEQPKPLELMGMKSYTYNQAPNNLKHFVNYDNRFVVNSELSKGADLYYNYGKLGQANLESQGYVYNKPFVAFHEGPLDQNIQIQKYHEFTHHLPAQGTVVQQPSVTIKKQTVNQQGYHYDNPIAVSQIQQQGYAYQGPTIHPTIINNKIKEFHYGTPAVSYLQGPQISQSFNNKFTFVGQPKISLSTPSTLTYNYKENQQLGYQYVKPVTFVEQPKVYVTPKPTVSTTYQEVKHEGYQYKKPSIPFEEEPKPAINIAQEVKQEGYHYEKPSIPFVEGPKISQTVTVTQPSVAYHEVQQKGYRYDKPSVTFEEEPKPVIPLQPAVTIKPIQAVSYQEVKHEQGYHYEKPTVTFVEEPKVLPVIPLKPTVSLQEARPQTVSYQEVKHEQGFHYEKPAVAFVEEPKIVQPVVLNQVKPTTSVSYQEVKQEGYQYEKPAVAFVEEPKVVQPIKPQLSVSYQDVKHEGYHYEKPSVSFIEEPKVIQPVVIPTKPQTVNYQEVKHTGYQYQKPAVAFVEEPKVIQPVEPTKPLTVNYQEVKHTGYQYQKPAFGFVEEPKVIQPVIQPVVPIKPQSVNYQEVKPTGYQYLKPAVSFVEEPKVIQPVIQPVLPIKPQTVNYQEVKHTGYQYQKPAVSFVELPKIVQPGFQVQHQSKPQINYQQVNHGYHYQKPITYIKQPKVVQPVLPIHQTVQEIKPQVTSYHEVKHEGYQYQKPAITFKEEPKPAIPLPKPTYHEYKNEGYHYQKPSISFVEQPKVIQPAVTYQEVNQGYHYQKPAVHFEEKPQTVVTYPKPVVNTYQTYHQHSYQRPQIYHPVQPITYQKIQPEIRYRFHEYKQPIITNYVTPKPVVYEQPQTVPKLTYKEVLLQKPAISGSYSIGQYGQGYHYEKPVIPFEEQPKTNPKLNYIPPKPTATYLPAYNEEKEVIEEPLIKTTAYKTGIIKSSPRPTYKSILAKIEPVPLQEYYYSYPSTTSRPIARYEYSSTPKFIINVPDREYLPASTKPTITKEYLPATQKVRITTTTESPREYLPPRRRPVKPVKPTNEYLPSRKITTTTTTRRPTVSREYLPVRQESSTRRAKLIKVIKTRPVVKQNDFHPILAAKLGAQCTCTSNTLQLRRKPPTSRISDLEEYQEVPKKQSVIIVAEEEDIIDQNEEQRKDDITKAVNSGLKLVKSAVKEGVREGVQEALSRDFDRYGPGGLRSKSETLQGIDCQRAGLFRHPTQCNKFYSCRWDCTKKKFTLHVFNCPVHLTFDNNLGACNWPSQGPACIDNTLLPN